MEDRLITASEVCLIARCSRATLYRRMKNSYFPKPVKVSAVLATTSARGPQTVNAWRHKDVMRWLIDGNDPAWVKQRAKEIETDMRLGGVCPDHRSELNQPQAKQKTLKVLSVVLTSIILLAVAWILLRSYND